MNRCASRDTLRRRIDGDLPEPERPALDRHVETCPRCQAELGLLSDGPLPPEVAAELRRTPVGGPPAVPKPALPDIELLEVIGRGGSGRVWKGRLKGVSQLVAVKVLTGGPHADAKQQERFLREVEVLSQLRHPGLIQLFHFGLTADGYYFSMQHLPAGSVADERKRADLPWPIRRAAEVAAAVARAIQHAHDRGVIHRDLKPGNILLAEHGRPVVADFGLAKRMTEAETTGTSAGTPCYMAPEQAAGKAVDERTDVYGIGAVLYDLLTGSPPIPPGGSDAETTRRVTADVPVLSPRFLRPETHADLEQVCLKCLEKDPRHRYPSAQAVADDLARFLAEEPVLARPVSPLGRARRWARRNPTVAALSAALGAVVLAALVATTTLWRAATTEAARATAEAAEAVRQRGLAQEALLAHADALVKAYESISLTTPSERERFGDAVARLLALLGDAGEAHDLQHRTAVALVRFGVLLGKGGETAPAERLLRTAAEHLGRLAERHPDDKMLRCDHSDALAEYGCVCIQAGRRADGIDRYRAGEDVAAAAAARWPASDHAKGVLASRRTGLALLLVGDRRFADSEPLFRAAVGPAGELARKYPRDYTRHEMLAALTQGLGRLLLARDGDVTGFLALHAGWDAHVDWLRDREPEKWGQLTRRWDLESVAAAVLVRTGRRPKAGEVLARLVTGCRAADPDDPATGPRLATNLALAATLFPPGDPRVAAYCEEAARLFDKPERRPVSAERLQRHAVFLVRCPAPHLRDAGRALELARQAVATDSASAAAQFTLAECLLAAGDWADAEQTLDQWLPKLAGSGRIHPLVHRAVARSRGGRVDAARGDVEEAIALARADWLLTWFVLDELVVTAKRITGKAPDLTPTSHPTAK